MKFQHHKTLKENTALRKRVEIVDLMLKGKTQCEISEIIGTTQSSVYDHIRKAKNEWRESIRSNIEHRMTDQLQKIDHLKKVCWEYLEKSEEGQITDRESVQEALRSVHKSGAAKENHVDLPKELTPVGRISEKETIRKCKADAQWASLIQKCIEMENKIYGLYQEMNFNLTQTNVQVNLFDQIAAEMDSMKIKTVDQMVVEGLPNADIREIAEPVGVEKSNTEAGSGD